VLDGALVKYLYDEVDDPVCREVFTRINADEARHLAVDFYMLERYGREPVVANARYTLAAAVHPAVLYALVLGYLPLLPRMRKNIDVLGVPPEALHACVQRYIELAEQSPAVGRHPTYALFRQLSRGIVAGRMGMLDFLMRLSDLCAALERRPPRHGRAARASIHAAS
jgi:hypothetical protein